MYKKVLFFMVLAAFMASASFAEQLQAKQLQDPMADHPAMQTFQQGMKQLVDQFGKNPAQLQLEVQKYLVKMQDMDYSAYAAALPAVNPKRREAQLQISVVGAITGNVKKQSNDKNIWLASVTAFDLNLNPVKTGFTDFFGNYSLSPLPNGDYYVMATALGFAQEFYNGVPYQDEASKVTVNTNLINTPSASTSSNINFKLESPYILMLGFVFEDINNTGQADNGDWFFQGLPVQLLHNGVQVRSTQTSGVLGQFEFALLPPSSVDVQLDLDQLPDCYNLVQAQPFIGDNPHSMTLTAGGADVLAWQVVLCPGTADGWVYDDLNKNGQHDDGEPGLDNVLVVLSQTGRYNHPNNPVDGNDSDLLTYGGGYYKFKNVFPGSYKVSVGQGTLPECYSASAGDGSADILVTPDGYTRQNFFFAECDRPEPCDVLMYMEGSGSPTYTGEDWTNAVDGDTTDWDGTVTTRGTADDLAGPASAVFKFGCAKKALFNRIAIKTDNGVNEIQQINRQAKQIEVWTSEDGVEFSLVTTIVHASRLWASYDMPADVVARYIKLVILQPTSANGAWRQLVEFKAEYQEQGDGLGKQIAELPAMPESYRLGQNYPNPFNPQTTITYELAQADHITLRVYDSTGREMATLVNGLQSAGQHQVTFRAGTLPSGTYFYQMTAGQFKDVKRMMLIK